MWIEDFAAFPDEDAPGDNLIAVGWLAPDKPYARGAVDAETYNEIQSLCSRPWGQPPNFVGMRGCSLCQFDGPHFAPIAYVPYQGRIFVTHGGLDHYIAAHWYQPPAEFVEAVKHCPPTGTFPYMKAMLENGGKGIVRWARANGLGVTKF